MRNGDVELQHYNYRECRGNPKWHDSRIDTVRALKTVWRLLRKCRNSYLHKALPALLRKQFMANARPAPRGGLFHAR
jgi:hypothetical protein